ncbi:nuclear distribution protein nudE-like 1 isoform X1 [Centruroides sculpturatus]|nr:nuclear distribution protein nudE-like 1 isoform X1 [Centruroides sculpturatus]
MDYKKKWKDIQQELEEFQESSRELEAELEAQLTQVENQNKELNSINSHLQMECEKLQDKLKQARHEGQRQTKYLQEELSRVTQIKDELHKYIRQLEQSNDDLERAKRATVSSLEDFEARLNNAIERNAFLENELDDKETLKVMVQRLKDEARDLKQELKIHQAGKLNNISQYLDENSKLESLEKCNERTEEDEKINTITKCLIENHEKPTVTPATRISALNIVGDLLRKVGALESKLSSCHNYVRENASLLEEDMDGSMSRKDSSPSKEKDSISLIA